MIRFWWLNLVMRNSNFIEDLSIETPIDIDANRVNDISQRKIPGRVDINHLMSKVREEKKKQKKENIVFFGLVSSVVVITGLIASL